MLSLPLHPLAQLCYGAVLTMSLMLVLWLLQRREQNAGIVDVGWTFGLGALAVFFAFTSGGQESRRLLVGSLAAVWALRLGVYLFRRVWGQPEDGRYSELRRRWKQQFQAKILAFFMAQAVLALLFGVPLLVALWSDRPGLDGWDALAFVVWLIAVCGESLADYQLALFKRDPASAGRTCRRGLWRWSRHPNYFFEWLHWWSYPLFSVGASAFWLTLLGPITMLYLLFKVTGVPATEAQALRSRGDDYRDYQRTTSVFFPWFSKES